MKKPLPKPLYQVWPILYSMDETTAAVTTSAEKIALPKRLASSYPIFRPRLSEVFEIIFMQELTTFLVNFLIFLSLAGMFCCLFVEFYSRYKRVFIQNANDRTIVIQSYHLISYRIKSNTII